MKTEGDIIIHDINITLHCGELTAIIGKNGAGKTTLLQAILGERPHNGKITFKSHDDAAIKAPKIGYVPQQLVFDKSTPVSVSDFMLSNQNKTAPLAWSQKTGHKQHKSSFGNSSAASIF